MWAFIHAKFTKLLGQQIDGGDLGEAVEEVGMAIFEEKPTSAVLYCGGRSFSCQKIDATREAACANEEWSQKAIR